MTQIQHPYVVTVPAVIPYFTGITVNTQHTLDLTILEGVDCVISGEGIGMLLGLHAWTVDLEPGSRTLEGFFCAQSGWR